MNKMKRTSPPAPSIEEKRNKAIVFEPQVGGCVCVCVFVKRDRHKGKAGLAKLAGR